MPNFVSNLTAGEWVGIVFALFCIFLLIKGICEPSNKSGSSPNNQNNRSASNNTNSSSTTTTTTTTTTNNQNNQ